MDSSLLRGQAERATRFGGRFDAELYRVQNDPTLVQLDDEVVERVCDAVDGDEMTRYRLEQIVRNIAGKYLAGIELKARAEAERADPECSTYGARHHFNGYGTCSCGAKTALADPPDAADGPRVPGYKPTTDDIASAQGADC